MPITWTKQQRDAIDTIRAWLAGDCGGKQVFQLAGYAGTGKTSLAKEIARFAGTTAFCAFTGRASDLMRRKGCNGARTIHSLIYVSQRKMTCGAEPACASPPCNPRCQYRRERFAGCTLNPASEVINADLVIVDECSMLGIRMGHDLLSFGKPVLGLGDKGQLPPVGDSCLFTDREPDVVLTELHRQALDSPIVRLATMARRGETLPYGQYGGSAVLPKLTMHDLLSHDVDGGGLR
jgi:exodeoxyribonuclease V